MSTSSCTSDSGIELTLNNLDTWRQFPSPMEMIVTKKPGRKIFPDLEYNIKGLDASKMYKISLHIERVDDVKYFYVDSGEWGKHSKAEPKYPVQVVTHKDGVKTGEDWMSEHISFDQVRITNNGDHEKKNHIAIQSMHLWRPVVTVKEMGGSPMVQEFRLDITQFMAVTKYQNEQIAKLKIAGNKFVPNSRPLAKRRISSYSDDSSSSLKKRSAFSLTQNSDPTPPPISSSLKMAPFVSPFTQNEQMRSSTGPVNFGPPHVFPGSGAGYSANPYPNSWNYNWMYNGSHMNYMDPAHRMTPAMNTMVPASSNTGHMNSFGHMHGFSQTYPPTNHVEPFSFTNYQKNYMAPMPPMMNPNTGYWDSMSFGRTRGEYRF